MSSDSYYKDASDNPGAAGRQDRLLPADSSHAQTPDSLSPAVPAAPGAPEASPHEASVARQKADFVGAAWGLSRGDHISVQDACAIVAQRLDCYPALRTAGKRGTSLLADKKAYTNFRVWAAKLGKRAGGAPDVAQWRALLPRYRGSRPYTRPGAPAYWPILARLYESPNRLSLAYAHRLACLACKQGNIPDPPPYEAARYHYTHKADQRAVFLAREGEDAFRNKIAGHITRDAPLPDEAWSGDHHLFDAAVQVWDSEHGRPRAVRPWLTAWIDWGSLTFMGVLVRAQAPDRDAIERALRIGLTRNELHPPVRLYIDNGKDYKAQGFSRPILSPRDTTRLETTSELLGAQVHFAIPYNARAKIAERCFRVVCEQFSKLWGSYRGSRPGQRSPEADRLWNNPEELPTLDVFAARFESWLACIYHPEPSRGRALQGKSPVQVRAAMTHPRAALSAADVYKAFLRQLPGPPRVIRPGGVVHALRREYRSDQLWDLMARGKQGRVHIKVDPDNVDRIWLYDVDGRELGTAERKPALPAFTDPARPETIEQLRSEQRRHARQTAAAKVISAQRRALGAWTTRAPAPIDVLAPTASAPALPATPAATTGRRPARPAAPEQSADPQLVAALNDALIQRVARNRQVPPRDPQLLAAMDRMLTTHK